jgi:hypothetical protein
VTSQVLTRVFICSCTFFTVFFLKALQKRSCDFWWESESILNPDKGKFRPRTRHEVPEEEHEGSEEE